MFVLRYTNFLMLLALSLSKHKRLIHHMHLCTWMVIIQAHSTVTVREGGGGTLADWWGDIIEVRPHLGLYSEHALQRAPWLRVGLIIKRSSKNILSNDAEYAHANILGILFL